MFLSCTFLKLTRSARPIEAQPRVLCHLSSTGPSPGADRASRTVEEIRKAAYKNSLQKRGYPDTAGENHDLLGKQP